MSLLRSRLISSSATGNLVVGPEKAFAAKLRHQWVTPGDIFSLLLILGGDIVQSALAQQVGPWVAPVSFSFGHVAYAINALLSVFGDGSLMPLADYDSIVITAQNGHQRNNKAWIIGRLLRDHEARSGTVLKDYKSKQEALRISVFKPAEKPALPSGKPRRDWIWWSGVGVIIFQAVVSVIPWILYGNWAIFMVTMVGTLLSLVQTANQQWSREKWACPTTGGSTVCITEGNGSRHVMVILGLDHLPNIQDSLNYEVLSTRSKRLIEYAYSRYLTSAMALLWVCFLITATGIRDDTWFLIIVGFVGIIHNLFVGAVPRDPSSLGIHISPLDTIAGSTVYEALRKAENDYPTVGASLISTFYPGGLRIKPEDKDFWLAAADRRGLESLGDMGVRLERSKSFSSRISEAKN